MNLKSWLALVVEDEPDSAQMVAHILEHFGYQVSVARNGRHCLHLLQDIHPDIVIMDLSMPELDGWRTLSEMRTDPITAPIPVIAMTAYHSVNVAQDAHRVGFDSYLSKPFDPKLLVSEIERLIS